MRPDKQLPSGKNTDDVVPDRGKPKDELEAVQNLIKDWEIVKVEYNMCEDDSPTYMQMYAMTGALRLVDGFLDDLRNLEKAIRELKGIA